MSTIQSSLYNENISKLQNYICNTATIYNGSDMECAGDCIFCLQKMQSAKDINVLKRYIRRFIKNLEEIIINDSDYYYLVETLVENTTEFQLTEILMREHGKDVFGEEL